MRKSLYFCAKFPKTTENTMKGVLIFILKKYQTYTNIQRIV